MTDAAVVARRLAMLREHLARLRRRRGDDASAAPTDRDLEDAVAMSLLVAVQQAIDIALHLAADEGWGISATHRESFETLARHGVIPDELAVSLAGAAQLRNRIAHGYATVDFPRVWTELPSGLDALDRFAAAIATRLVSP